MSIVYVIGTGDTKEAELRYAVERVRAAGAKAMLVDISTTPSTADAEVTPEMVARFHVKSAEAVLGLSDRILVLHEGKMSGAFTRVDATPEKVMAAATGQEK